MSVRLLCAFKPQALTAVVSGVNRAMQSLTDSGVPNPKFPDLTPIFNILRVPWPERSLPVGAP